MHQTHCGLYVVTFGILVVMKPTPKIDFIFSMMSLSVITIIILVE